MEITSLPSPRNPSAVEGAEGDNESAVDAAESGELSLPEGGAVCVRVAPASVALLSCLTFPVLDRPAAPLPDKPLGKEGGERRFALHEGPSDAEGGSCSTRLVTAALAYGSFMPSQSKGEGLQTLIYSPMGAFREPSGERNALAPWLSRSSGKTSPHSARPTAPSVRGAAPVASSLTSASIRTPDKGRDSAYASGERSSVKEPRDEQEGVTARREEREGQGGYSGSSEGGDDEPEGEGSLRIEKVDPKLMEDFFTSVAEEDWKLLADLRALRITHLDVILLFLEVLKLFLRSQEEERLARRQERQYQLEHMEHVVQDFKSQGKYQIISSTLSGVLSLASGVLPIVGFVGGDSILRKLQNVPLLNKLSGMPSQKLFKQLEKMTSALSESQKNMGQIQTTFLEGNRFFHQHMGEMRKTDAEEDTRTIDELKDHWRNLEGLITRFLQMEQDTIHQLYR